MTLEETPPRPDALICPPPPHSIPVIVPPLLSSLTCLSLGILAVAVDFWAGLCLLGTIHNPLLILI